MTEPGAPYARDHGGNLDAAVRRHGGVAGDWIDLSTGINPVPYPVPPISERAWTVLPQAADMERLRQVAAHAYDTDARIVPVAGAQAAIQLYPLLARPGVAKVLTPTYNEHGAALRSAGWRVEDVEEARGLQGADLAVVVNPNNPDGRRMEPDVLLDLAESVGVLVVDESFADPEPRLSLAPRLETHGNVVVLRSFGKFYGLAGVRLGFAVAIGDLGARLAELAGPWPVSGPAIEIASAALADTGWQRATTERLAADAARLDGQAAKAGWHLVGGTPLFRTFDAGEAGEAQERLARHHIWSRIFPYSARWIRLGLPGTEADWTRLETALAASR